MSTLPLLLSEQLSATTAPAREQLWHKQIPRATHSGENKVFSLSCHNKLKFPYWLIEEKCTQIYYSFPWSVWNLQAKNKVLPLPNCCRSLQNTGLSFRNRAGLHLKEKFLKSVLSWLQLLYTPDRNLSSALTRPMSFPPLLTNKSSHNLVGTHRTDHTADLRVLFRLQVNSLALVIPAKRKKKGKCMNLLLIELDRVNLKSAFLSTPLSPSL